MRLLILVLSCLTLASCMPRFVRVKIQEDVGRYLDDIHVYNQQVVQLKASIDIKASGVMAAYAHEQADVVVAKPQYIHLSLRSFFGPPSLIFASNGEFITIYDFTGESREPYQKTLLKENNLFSLLDFDVHPRSLITLLLAKIPVEEASNLEIFIKDEQLLILADLKFGFKLRSIFDHEKKHVLETRLTNEEMDIAYEAIYQRFHIISGIYFPQSLVLMSKGKSRFARFTIEFLTTELNGDLVSPDFFYLKPQ